MEETLHVEGTGILQTRLYGAEFERLAIRLGKLSWPISLVINVTIYTQKKRTMISQKWPMVQAT